jgi:O-antigen ligase
MDAIAELLFYIAIASFCAGVSLNLRYVVALPGRIARNTRWYATVWLVMLAGLATWFGRSERTTDVTSLDTSAIMQVGSIVIAGLSMLHLAGRSFDSRNLHLPFVLLLIFAVVGLLTAPLAAYPALAMFKAASVVVAVVLAVMAIKPLIVARDPGLLFNVVYIYFAFIAFLAVVGGLLEPEVARQANKGVFGFMLKGWPSLNSNTLSYVTGVVFVISLRRVFSVERFRQRLLYIGVGSVGAIGLVLAQGRTSLLSSFLAVIFMAFFVKEMRPFRHVALGLAVLLVIAFVLTGSVGDWVDNLEEYMRRGVDDESLSTLSGRTHAWSVSWDLFLESPFIGYGFYASGKALLAPHNAYFTVLLNGGLLGFLPWVAGIIGGLWAISRRVFERSWREPTGQNSLYIEVLAVMIVQFLRTVTGQDLTIHSYSMLMFLSGLVYVYAREGMRQAETQMDAVSPLDNETPPKKQLIASDNRRILQAKRRGIPP